MSQIRGGFTFSAMYMGILEEQVLMQSCENCLSRNVLEDIPPLSVPERSCIECLVLASKRAFDYWLDNIQIQKRNDNLQKQVSDAETINSSISEQLSVAQAQCLSLHQKLLQSQEENASLHQQLHGFQDKNQPLHKSPSAHALASGFCISFGTIIWPWPPVKAIFPWSQISKGQQLYKSQGEDVREKGEGQTPFTNDSCGKIHPKPESTTFGSPSAHAIAAGICVSFGTIDWPSTLYPAEPVRSVFPWSK